jgi:hypothetical protein
MKKPVKETLRLEEMDVLLEECFKSIKIMANSQTSYVERINLLEGRITFLEDEYYDYDEDRTVN